MRQKKTIAEWRVDIKNVLKKFSLELNHGVLFLYGSQLKDPRDINIQTVNV